MKHYQHLTDEKHQLIFHKNPHSFDKHTDKETLCFALGATLYMPSYQKIAAKIIGKDMRSLTSFVMCFEDAIREDELEQGQKNVKNTLQTLFKEVSNGIISSDDIPLLFLRVRNEQQFESFVSNLTKEEASLLAGFTFPKFDSSNGKNYLQLTKEFSTHFQTPLYGMPILESAKIIYKESRLEELLALKELVHTHKEQVLNIRVGGTDFSSLFALRRGIDCTVYDIMVVADTLRDIQNLFMRAEDGFVLSAPVWEYFADHRLLKPRIRTTPFIEKKMLNKRDSIIDKSIDGLIQELIKDKANGFVGKTIIHPSHINYVNAFQAVTKEEYDDAMMIVGSEHQRGGVMKSTNGNKMNEINPHREWAKKTLKKADVYGVIKESDDLVDLF